MNDNCLYPDVNVPTPPEQEICHYQYKIAGKLVEKVKEISYNSAENMVTSL